MSLFRARGKDTSRVMTIDDMLSYRDAYTQPLPDFNFDNIMIEATRAQQPVAPPTLVSSENAFKHVDASTLSDKQQYRRKIQVLLNKLTESNADILIGEILVPEVLLEDNVTVVVELIFDKALDETFFLTTYIKLINALAKYEASQDMSASQTSSPTTPTSPTVGAPITGDSNKSRVRRSLISKSQAIFEEQFGKDTEGMCEEDIDLKRKQEIANVTFVAELLNSGLLSWRVFTSIMQTLFVEPAVDGHVELGLKLVSLCGKKIDEGGPEIKAFRKFHPADFFAYIEKIAKPVDKPPQGISFRVWFAAKNIVELRENKWTTKTVKAEPAPAPPPPPPAAKAPPAKDADAIKRAKEAQPPEWLTDDMKRDVVKRVMKEILAKDEDSDAPINWDAVITELGSIHAGSLPPICRRAVGVPLIKHFCSISKEDVRKGMTPLMAKWGVNELTHAAAWVIADAIMCCDLEDAPKFFDRLAVLLTDCVSVQVVDTVFARSSAFLEALYADNDGEPRWHSEYCKAWDLYIAAVKTKRGQLMPVDKLLDAFAKVFSPFLQHVFLDMIEGVCSSGLAERDDVRKWIDKVEKGTDKRAINLAAEINFMF